MVRVAFNSPILTPASLMSKYFTLLTSQVDLAATFSDEEQKYTDENAHSSSIEVC